MQTNQTGEARDKIKSDRQAIGPRRYKIKIIAPSAEVAEKAQRAMMRLGIDHASSISFTEQEFAFVLSMPSMSEQEALLAATDFLK